MLKLIVFEVCWFFKLIFSACLVLSQIEIELIRIDFLTQNE